jgi:hypothetical protein
MPNVVNKSPGSNCKAEAYAKRDSLSRHRRARDSNLTTFGSAPTVIARGTGLVPTFLTAPGGGVPKNILAYEGKATLDYYRRKNDENVLVKFEARGEKHQILRFNMAEPMVATADDHVSFDGAVGLWAKQTLQRAGPWSSPSSSDAG